MSVYIRTIESCDIHRNRISYDDKTIGIIPNQHRVRCVTGTSNDRCRRTSRTIRSTLCIRGIDAYYRYASDDTSLKYVQFMSGLENHVLRKVVTYQYNDTVVDRDKLYSIIRR